MKNGSLLNYVDQGEQGRPVILIHGLAASLYDWETLMPELALAGYHPFAVDLLGHGDSAKPADPQFYSLKSLYATLEEWIESLPVDPPYILVGHSLGGHLSLKFGLRNPEKVSALTLIGPYYSPRQLSPFVRWLYRNPALGAKALEALPLKIVDLFMDLDPTAGAHLTPQARRQTAIDLKRASPQILNIPRTLPDLTGELGRLRLPVQVIWGDRDVTLNPASFPRLVSSLRDATGHRIHGSGHQPHLEKPRLANDLVLDFLNRRMA